MSFTVSQYLASCAEDAQRYAHKISVTFAQVSAKTETA
jgi:hypothetical protein